MLTSNCLFDRPSLNSNSFPGILDGKESACNAGDLSLIPRSGRYPGEGNDNPLQYACRRVPRTEEPGAQQYMGPKELDTNTHRQLQISITELPFATNLLSLQFLLIEG